MGKQILSPLLLAAWLLAAPGCGSKTKPPPDLRVSLLNLAHQARIEKSRLVFLQQQPWLRERSFQDQLAARVGQLESFVQEALRLPTKDPAAGQLLKKGRALLEGGEADFKAAMEQALLATRVVNECLSLQRHMLANIKSCAIPESWTFALRNRVFEAWQPTLQDWIRDVVKGIRELDHGVRTKRAFLAVKNLDTTLKAGHVLNHKLELLARDLTSVKARLERRLPAVADFGARVLEQGRAAIKAGSAPASLADLQAIKRALSRLNRALPELNQSWAKLHPRLVAAAPGSKAAFNKLQQRLEELRKGVLQAALGPAQALGLKLPGLN